MDLKLHVIRIDPVTFFKRNFKGSIIIHKAAEQVFRAIKLHPVLILWNRLCHEFHNFFVSFGLKNTRKGIEKKILEKIVEPDHYRLLKPLQGLADALYQQKRTVELKAIQERIDAIEKKYPQHQQSNKRAA